MEISTIKTLAATSPKRLFTYRETATKILALETQLGIAPSKPILHIWRANERVSELESMVAAHAKSAAPVVVAPVVAPVLEKFGRERFNASCVADAAKKPKLQSHPKLHGRDRFCAAVRVDGTPQILPGNSIPAALDDSIKEKLTGRARFNQAVAKDFKK
jgi:hypothetical protein